MNFFKDPKRRPFIFSVLGVVILFLIIFPWVRSVQYGQMRDIQRIASVRTLEAALEQYADRAASFPATDATKQDFVCMNDKASGLSVLREQKLLMIMPSLPTGDCVLYRPHADGKDYQLQITLEKGNLFLVSRGD